MSWWAWSRAQRAKQITEGVEKAFEHQREMMRLEAENRELRESAARQRELDKMLQTSGLACPGCTARKESIEVLNNHIQELERALAARDETLQRFHGGGWERAQAEAQLEVTRLKAEQTDIVNRDKNPRLRESEERGAHAGQIELPEPTGPQANAALEDAFDI